MSVRPGDDPQRMLSLAIACVLDRRTFMIGAGSLVTASVLTWPGTAVSTVGPTAPQLADWTIDDMWGVWPRPAESIGYGHPGPQPAATAHPPDVDWTV